MLEINPGLEGKTLFEDLQRKTPGEFGDGQLRALQRRIKHWKAVEGHFKEFLSPQIHKPGELCQSDFTHMDKLGIMISGLPFDHMIYHFVLTYSNWEAGTICFSESFESLSQGLQNALWELGGVPENHRTDCLTTAVHKAIRKTLPEGIRILSIITESAPAKQIRIVQIKTVIGKRTSAVSFKYR